MLPQPHNAIVAVTLNCNARCTMCDNPGGSAVASITAGDRLVII